uniref:ShKT domain-containing protein n=1 Tax=Steinernema glaseri TaxID=37863 RepID=A0A1I7Z3S4_9BILA
MKYLIAVVFLATSVAVARAQLPDCPRVSPTSGCFCNATVECPRNMFLKCDHTLNACELFFDQTNTFDPCTAAGVCPYENQICYHGWCVYVPFVVPSTKPTVVFPEFTTPKPTTTTRAPVVRPRRPLGIRPVRPCIDFIHPGKCYSECPSRRHLCNSPLYYDVMTVQCPLTCNRCYDNFNVGCPYGMGGMSCGRGRYGYGHGHSHGMHGSYGYGHHTHLEMIHGGH